MANNITDRELDQIIHSYLLERQPTFHHSSFVFRSECVYNSNPIDEDVAIPPGTFTRLIQKALHSIEMEAKADIQVAEDFSFDIMDLISKDVAELQNIAKDDYMNKRQKAKGKELAEEKNNNSGKLDKYYSWITKKKMEEKKKRTM